eukprot:g644.t1
MTAASKQVVTISDVIEKCRALMSNFPTTEIDAARSASTSYEFAQICGKKDMCEKIALAKYLDRKTDEQSVSDSQAEPNTHVDKLKREVGLAGVSEPRPPVQEPEEVEEEKRGVSKGRSVNFEEPIEQGEDSQRTSKSSINRFTDPGAAARLESHKGLLKSSMTQVAKMKLYRMQKDGGSRLRSCHIFMFSLSLSEDEFELVQIAAEPKVTLICILNSRVFGLCVASMIIFNSILLGLDINRHKDPLEEQILLVLGETCNIFFFIELTMRLWCYKLTFFCGEEQGWNLFDLFLVISSVIDVIFTYLAADMSPALAGSVKMLKLFRQDAQLVASVGRDVEI